MKHLRTFLLGLALAVAAPLIGTPLIQLGQQLAQTAPEVSAPLVHYGSAVESAMAPSAHAAGVTDYTENKVVDHIFRATAWTAPTTLCVALFTSAPSDSAAGTEASYTGYARGCLAPSVANWYSTNGATSGVSSGTSGQTCNASTITIGSAATSGPQTVTHFGLYDASSSGNMVFYGTLTNSAVINTGSQAPTIPAGSICFTPGD